MADDDQDQKDAPWGDGPKDPPLSDIDNPLVDDDDEKDDDGNEWIAPVP
jgi:hypothetical protein